MGAEGIAGPGTAPCQQDERLDQHELRWCVWHPTPICRVVATSLLASPSQENSSVASPDLVPYREEDSGKYYHFS